MYRMRGCGLAWLLSAFVVAGCGKDFGSHTETERFDFKVPATSLTRLEVNNPNGPVTLTGISGTPNEIEIQVEQTATGSSSEDVDLILGNVDVYADKSGATERIGWRYKPNGPQHGVAVHLSIKAPAHLVLEVKAKNGSVAIDGFENPVTVSNLNGEVKVLKHKADVNVETRNGNIVFDTAGEKMRLVTYNGRITADLSRAKRIDGALIANNGPIGVVVGQETDAEFTCESTNGNVDFATQYVKNMSPGNKRRRPTVGKAGDGAGKVKIESRNGGIRLR